MKCSGGLGEVFEEVLGAIWSIFGGISGSFGEVLERKNRI